MNYYQSKIKISIITSYYRGERYINKFLESLRAQTCFSECEFIIILNNPHPNELSQFEKFQNSVSIPVKIVSNNNVEPLGKSWNKGCKISKGEFIALWNVDDLRNKNSLSIQIQSLISNPDCELSYGDYIVVNRYGNKVGKIIKTIQFNKNQFKNGQMTGGGFLVFRKEILNKIGYFDEQLFYAVDYDFEQRIVNSNYKMIKSDSILGYFTDEGLGLSTKKSNNLVEIEKIFVRYRYGIFDRVKWEYLPTIKKYDYKTILNNDCKIPIENFLPNYKKLIFTRQYRKFFGVFWNMARLILKNLGLLDFYRNYRNKLIGLK